MDPDPSYASRSRVSCDAGFITKEDGQDLVKYAFLVGLIGLVAAAAVTILGTTVNGYYTTNIAAAAPVGLEFIILPGNRGPEQYCVPPEFCPTLSRR